jgi:hypothetical protein
MDMVATQNFRSVDRLLEKPAPQAAEQLEKLTWGVTEVALGAALLLVLIFGSSETNFSLLLALLMLLIAIVQRFALTPHIVFLGRIIDWVPADQPSPERARFWMLHHAFVGLELLNWALGFSLTAKLLFRSRRRSVDRETENYARST